MTALNTFELLSLSAESCVTADDFVKVWSDYSVYIAFFCVTSAFSHSNWAAAAAGVGPNFRITVVL